MQLNSIALAACTSILLSSAAVAADQTAKPSATPGATPAASTAAKISGKKACNHKKGACAGKKASACKGSK